MIPPIVVGIIFATLLITIVGTWAGLILGITTMLTKDVYHKHINPQAGDRKILGIQRILILALTAISIFFVVGNEVPPHAAGFANALVWGIGTSGGAAVGPVLIGLLAGIVGLAQAMLILTCLGLASVLAVPFIRKPKVQ